MPESEEYSFQKIWETIYNKVSEIATWNGAIIWAVYNHDVKIEWWIDLPAITITPSNWTVQILDSCSYQSTYKFSVKIFDRIQDGIAGVEANMRILADKVMSKLKEISTITWTNSSRKWMSVKVEYEWNWRYSNTQEPLRLYEITMTFTAVEK